MRWMDHYRGHLFSAEDAVRLIRSNEVVYVSGNAATPFALLRALSQHASSLESLELVHVLELGKDPFDAVALRNTCRHRSLFVGPADRKAVNDGRAHYVPIFLSEIPKLFALGRPALDTALIHVSPPDEHGFVSLGAEVIATMSAVEHAKKIVAQVNSKMPRTLGDCFVHVSRISAFVEVDEPLPELDSRDISEVERKIGARVAELISDGATLQLGIGAIPDAVLDALGNHKDLGVHTEMVSDGVIRAIERGIVTGARKSIHPGKVVATFALGSDKLYPYIDDNPIFEFRPCDYTNDPFVVAQNDNLVAINSAIEVDITGQVCADSVGTRIHSGFGGQLDFIRGASRSKGGVPIIALPSTARDGELSRITPALISGAGVVTTRGDVHFVVTEYGAADLYGRSLPERARMLIDIAHPKFRDMLEAAAKERRLL
jgi:acyl-CoA hydrolase